MELFKLSNRVLGRKNYHNSAIIMFGKQLDYPSMNEIGYYFKITFPFLIREKEIFDPSTTEKKLMKCRFSLLWIWFDNCQTVYNSYWYPVNDD